MPLRGMRHNAAPHLGYDANQYPWSISYMQKARNYLFPGLGYYTVTVDQCIEVIDILLNAILVIRIEFRIALPTY
jgi:hypothetical protein